MILSDSPAYYEIRAMPSNLRLRSFSITHAKSPTSRRCLSICAPPIPPLQGFARLTSRRLILLAGRDAPHFLQGLTTRNIPPASSLSDQNPNSGFYSAFLNAPGRVLHDVFIYPGASSAYGGIEEPPRFLIEVDANEVQTLARHLKRYKLRAKVTVDVLDEDEVGVWSAWDEDDHAGILGKMTRSRRESASCIDRRVGSMGVRLLQPSGQKPEIDGDEVPLESYHVRRILKGVAEGQSEIFRESALPLESNMDYTGGIDFRKGCYVGQELTIRTHHTGVVRKRILPVQLYRSLKPPDQLAYDPGQGMPLPPQGTDTKSVDRKGRSTGKWLAGVGNIGLALCRLENMTDITLTGDSNQWSPEHEFKMAWAQEEGQEGSEVEVKAFVPEWHRNRINVRDTHRINNEGNV